NRITPDLNDNPGIFIGLVPHRGNVCDDLFVHQFGDSLNQQRPIYVVRYLSDHNLFAAAFDLFKTDFATHFETAATRGEIVLDALQAANHATCWEIRALD